jgi:hypothetical protein
VQFLRSGLKGFVGCWFGREVGLGFYLCVGFLDLGLLDEVFFDFDYCGSELVRYDLLLSFLELEMHAHLSFCVLRRAGCLGRL